MTTKPDAQETPKGELTMQTLALPANTNPNGDIFGGWLVSQMDLAAGIIAKRVSRGRASTVAINSMAFHHPVHVGDVVSCHAKLVKIGKTSVTIDVEAWKEVLESGKKFCVTEGTFIFVAIDSQGRPREVPRDL